MCATPVKRKLAAILAADAVGYSKLMAADEEGTMKILAAHRGRQRPRRHRRPLEEA